MASASKRPRAENYSVEEALQMVFDEDEAHGGMSSDEESKLDMELASWSDFSR